MEQNFGSRSPDFSWCSWPYSPYLRRWSCACASRDLAENRILPATMPDLPGRCFAAGWEYSKSAAPCGPAESCQLKFLFLRSEHLAQDVLQDSAILVIGDFERGVHARDRREVLFFAGGVASADL